jgi:hypothetical protein
MQVHNIGVVWHFCDGAGCSFKAKTRPQVTRHTKAMHS